jgi:hypothetical protein
MHEDVWFIEILGESTLEFNKEKQVDEHLSYILEEPPDPQFYEKLLESFFPTFARIYESCNHPMTLLHHPFERMVMDDFVYHKHSKSHNCLCTSFCSPTARVNLIT